MYLINEFNKCIYNIYIVIIWLLRDLIMTHAEQ
jgi:hypothetical protein